MHAFDRRVEVTAGMPRRPRDLQLFVPMENVSSYAWGTTCEHSRELARAILTFALNHVEECPSCGTLDDGLEGKERPSRNQIDYFLVWVVADRDAGESWSISLTEVRRMLREA
jgi:hypothetical protein